MTDQPLDGITDQLEDPLVVLAPLRELLEARNHLVADDGGQVLHGWSCLVFHPLTEVHQCGKALVLHPVGELQERRNALVLNPVGEPLNRLTTFVLEPAGEAVEQRGNLWADSVHQLTKDGHHGQADGLLEVVPLCPQLLDLARERLGTVPGRSLDSSRLLLDQSGGGQCTTVLVQLARGVHQTHLFGLGLDSGLLQLDAELFQRVELSAHRGTVGVQRPREVATVDAHQVQQVAAKRVATAPCLVEAHASADHAAFDDQGGLAVLFSADTPLVGCLLRLVDDDLGVVTEQLRDAVQGLLGRRPGLHHIAAELDRSSTDLGNSGSESTGLDKVLQPVERAASLGHAGLELLGVGQDRDDHGVLSHGSSCPGPR